MPMRDSIHGIKVVTIFDMFQQESDETGQAPGDVAADFWSEFDRDLERCNQAFKEQMADPESARKFIQMCYAGDWDGWHWSDPDYPGLSRVLTVLKAAASFDFHGSKEEVVARCLFGDGSVRYVHCIHAASHGSFYEPPEDEVDFRELSSVPMTYVPGRGSVVDLDGQIARRLAATIMSEMG